MSVARQVVTHAFPMMLAQLIPLAASFAVVSLGLALGRNDFVTVIGAMATIGGLSTLVNVGVGIGTLRDLARAQHDPHSVTVAVSRNLRIASAVSVIVLTVSVITTVAFWFALPDSSGARTGIWVAFAIQVPSYAIASQASVLTAAFQHLDKEQENLAITVVRTLGGLLVGIAVVVLVRDPVTAIALQSAVVSIMAAAMLAAKRRRLSHSEIRVRLFATPDVSPLAIWDRVVNSLDGAVFMVLFMVAQLIAASVSVEVGAQIAAGVAFCRTVILPLKMVGLTAGRMNLRDPGHGWKFARASFGATTVFVVPVALGLVGAAVFGISTFGSVALTLLIAAQLLLEPFSGSLFAYLKVSFGGRSGLFGLILTYLVLAPTLLVACRIAFPTAEALWFCLLIVRFCFSGTTLLALGRGACRTGGNASGASGIPRGQLDGVGKV